MAPGWNATSVAPIAATIGQWFDRKRGLALNLALSGATVAGLVVAPALLAAIPRLGFAEAERLLVAIGLVLAAGAVALFVRRGPLSFKPTATPAEPPGAAPALAFLEHLGALRLRAHRRRWASSPISCR